ncbi:c-type cytochrome [Halarcobacter bivalviorum]|uniref:Cytochrome C n=1 Tax=Halarcobacter bivalviorum TaxID=663364 RepID=A0AAX2ACE1_9BACT|nr:cytochrome c [Halarcobacter bivalviorum]AXH12670.1 cytochrome c [Halarcobacter bivalviorum]RXK10406.1 cytochrome C [Halarcobacter bivalviorum]
MNLINNKTVKQIVFALLSTSSLFAQTNLDSQLKESAEKVFKTYCWGCHHQTSIAFGPSFKEIANKREKGEIMGYIASPLSLYKEQGYKRSVMPSFANHLSAKELDVIADYIISFKEDK